MVLHRTSLQGFSEDTWKPAESTLTFWIPLQEEKSSVPKRLEP